MQPHFAFETSRHPSAAHLADTAVWALVQEAELTPKPALVDGRGCGVHPDLSLYLMRRSAHALHAGFYAMGVAAAGRVPDRPLREELAAIGREAECEMMLATGGANAHRGAIWALGLLLAAVAMDPDGTIDDIAARAAELARLPDRFIPTAPSHGQSVAQRYGVSGARGEAQAGFPHALKVCLPALRHARGAGISEYQARLDALLSVVAVLDDTCLLHRGGPPALHAAQIGAHAVLAVGGSSTPAGAAALAELDAALTALNASPGGAADMLAAALFIDAVRGAALPRETR
jgi:triphosphoribosyl-dephospho-CoA synthase